MKNIVKPETARKLKEVGFKQSEHEAGQVWYNRGGLPYFVGTRPNNMLCFISSYGGSYEWLHDSDGFVFAPTATDILLELGEDWTMIVAGGGFQIYKHFQDPQYIFPVAANDNPAEAAALAWLEKYTK